MNFIKTFLAAILAFVVGSFLVFFLWIFILLGIAALDGEDGGRACGVDPARSTFRMC